MEGSENAGRGLKRKSRLAVFEHVGERKRSSKRKKFQPNYVDSEDSSPSDSELVIDDKELPTRQKKKPLIKLSEEPLNLQCEWNFCLQSFESWKLFNMHLIDHATTDAENIGCQWRDCHIVLPNEYLLMQHVSYHGYLTKLKNIGQNVIDRNDWPTCNQKEEYKTPICLEGYTCEWEYCSFNFCTIYDFYSHIEVHVHNNPSASKNGIIECLWQGCHTKFSTKCKLGEHVRIHTKEKTIACPTCCTLFSNKTKFGDHRRRQLASDLQSYQCSQCLKLFPTERLLRDHMRSHINHYKCTMCDMTCPKPSILAKHMRFKHINDKPFKCVQCSKAFVTKHNMQTHLRTHSSEKWIKCELCDYKCRAKVSLDTHYAAAHDKAASVYECHCCKKSFKRGDTLTKHLMKVHNYHWPSGHSRFRYRRDQDGIHRLQTVRYESLEVTQEMIKSESLQSSNTTKTVNYSLKYDGDGKSNYLLTVTEDGEQSLKVADQEQNNILITINDVDEHGNIVRTEVLESGEMLKMADDDNSSLLKNLAETKVDVEENEVIEEFVKVESMKEDECVEHTHAQKEESKKRKKKKKKGQKKSKSKNVN